MLLLDEQHRLGEDMKRDWQVRRAVAEYNDGQHRWDYAYQFLLRWMMEQTVEQLYTGLPSQENDHEDRRLCSSIDQPSNAKPKHRTTD